LTTAQYRGVPASPGIAIGPAYVLRRERLVIPEYHIEEDQIEGELSRLNEALELTRRRLATVREGMKETGLIGDIFDAQFLFLKDPTLIENASEYIRGSRLNAEWALQRELRRLERMFESMSDPYLRERASDVGFVVRRVLQALMGREPEGLKNAPPGVVVVSEDLSPGEVAQVRRGQVAGFVTEAGSRTSHVTIIARSLEIPAVVGTEGNWVEGLSDGTPLILDGRSGLVIVNPEPEVIAEYDKRRADDEVLERRLLRFVPLPAETRDGVSMRMLANVDQIEEIPDARRYGAEGIGLYRTEFLFLNRTDLPDEDEQLASYRAVVKAIAPDSAVIRTLDLGGEKVPTGLDLTEEPNPALGLRGVRMSAARPALFKTQLRALLRASDQGRVKVLIPMISTLAEVKFARRTFEEMRAQVLVEGYKSAGEVEFGIMIETPAAAMTADLIAPHADFLSIGTNDLIQYTLAVDRTNEQVGYLYEPLHPANLRMIQRISQAARRAGIVAGMCGEMAGDPLHSWILLALGLGELSMAPFSIPLLKKIFRDSSAAEARALLSDVMYLGSADEIRAHVERTMVRRFPVEFERMVLSG
jgi:phosphotransferase system enzyme I (PtsI)